MIKIRNCNSAVDIKGHSISCPERLRLFDIWIDANKLFCFVGGYPDIKEPQTPG